jgi:hypothetical protein
MMFRIVITKEENVTATEQEWQQLYPDQDTAEANNAKLTHGYVDKKVERVRVTQLLDQRVDDLDLKKVIVAINDLPEIVPGDIAKFLEEGNMKVPKSDQSDTTEA